MNSPSSKSADNRKQRKHQVGEQRESILVAAEQLFLRDGLENTSMIDIADQAGITRVTLYRYFANRDEIALEIHKRMIDKINSRMDESLPQDPEWSLEGQRKRVQSMIRNFPHLRDAFRYIGMFDKIYLDHGPEHAITQWTMSQLAVWNQERGRQGRSEQRERLRGQMPVILNTVVWFLEKLALRGELTWSDKNVPLEEDLRIFEAMIMGYFERLAAEEQQL